MIVRVDHAFFTQCLRQPVQILEHPNTSIPHRQGRLVCSILEATPSWQSDMH
jgi:hypothetical protein